MRYAGVACNGERKKGITAAAFGTLLSSYRRAAGLSQAKLADLAGLSRRGIADLERGARRTPHQSTERRLADALRLEEVDRRALLVASRTVPVSSDARRRGEVALLPTVPSTLLEEVLEEGHAGTHKMLLGVLNVLAAPFGTQEWMLTNYGVEKGDFAFNERGLPILTPVGRAETTVPWRYVPSASPVLFEPTRSVDFAMIGHAAEQAMLDARVDDPARGLFSATAFKSGIVAERALYAGISDIVQARRPVADLNQLVNDWRNSAGDAMRAEYQEALQRHD